MKGPAPTCGLGTEPVILLLGALSWALIIGGLAFAAWAVTR